MRSNLLVASVSEPLSVALTFDDGYLDHYPIARLLHKHGIRASFFLITSLRQWNNKPLLTIRPELIREMRKMNHEIGSHTQSHPNLRDLTDGDVERELRDSKAFLEGLLEEEVKGFAYPYGKYDARISRIVPGFYEYARAASDVDKPGRYELPIRSPGLSLRHCSLMMTGSMVRGKGFVTLLQHSISHRSLRAWTEYMKLFRVRFVTLSQLVETQYD